ncbi:hypothetical protein [Algoriphagus sp. A40]|uniref:hypothetical protein n=1 Tax=Algoriphagus sp. A40 TaxID=1945863 RepID=UPI00098474A9|nr:hypothetical protein [Algoriphagus sp. A40]OOG76732.1 hypothetical protein B0E43_06995 [Algoriphagus sp. A40]
MIEELIWIAIGVLAATSTYWIHTRFRISPVLASSLISLLIALAVLPFGESSEWLGPIPYAGIGGSFIGMSTKKNVKGLESVLLAAIIFGVIFSRSSHFFEGFGGALGTSACISVLTAISWRKFIKRTRFTTRQVVNRVTK